MTTPPAVTWAVEQLLGADVAVTGPAEVHSQTTWATVFTIPTATGKVWLKASNPRTAYEVRLYRVLANTVPERVLMPIAADPERGWIVLPDGGTSLGERVGDDGMLEALGEALPAYAELQRAMARRCAELFDAGVPDMRPAVMPERFEEALQEVGGDAEVAALEPKYRAWCDELVVAPGGASIDHNDLHLWNVIPGPRFYDWGDSVVAHPFASLLLPLTLVRDRVGPQAVRPARDSYLEAWSDVASHAELTRTLELACHVAKAARALTWIRAGDGTRAPRYCLRALLTDSYLGGT